ncbi:MAG: TonB-dependent receptor [bacterium]|nr:TonB-dependent receptor [bacterium]
MRRVLFSMALLAVVAGAAFGQAQRGTVTVTVADEDGSRLPGASVEAQSDQTLTRRVAVTDAAGQAVLAALDPATNYVVTTTLDGFATVRSGGIVVRAGQDVPITIVLSVGAVAEEIVVTGDSPIVDVTSAVTGQDITLQLTESLPTQRSYQDYLQLVPGVQAPVEYQGRGLNPASRSGINYRDLQGEVGESRDNYYYFEGINVTDLKDGVGLTDLNTEIIQEQSVLTGGLPAEYVGAQGLVSNVITKSGGNQFTGSVNYYIQNDSLVESDKNFEDQDFDITDAAVTFGGPLVRDKAWFFASFRNVNREDTITNAQGTPLRTVERDSDQSFFKISFAATDKDLFSGVFLDDPTDVTGQANPNLQNNRDFGEERGGERTLLSYSRVFANASLELGFSEHEGDLNSISALQEPRNDVSFRSGDPFTPFVDEQLGGDGNNDGDTRGTESLRGSLEYLFDSSWGDHSIKFGFDFAEATEFEDENYVGGTGGTNDWTSLDTRYLGQNISNQDIVENFTTVFFDALTTDDYVGFIEGLDRLSATDQATVFAAYDTNNDGTISQAELAANMTYNSTAGNPDGLINYSRRQQTASGAATGFIEGTTYYLQDNWQWKRWSVNAGIRTEEWEQFADTGESAFTFDNEIAPRVSVAYDLRGDGKERLSFYYGRYYDPIRLNATDFVGALTSRVLEEQVFVDPIGQWVNYRTRGGVAEGFDGFFAPATATPYTDEYQVGYKRDIGRNMSFEGNLIMRETRDIIEDYSPTLYNDDYPGPVDDPDSLFLGLDFFGFTTRPNANFLLMTLPPGNFRDWDGIELIFRKRYSDNWQMIASFNYADGEANTSSDSNFDFAGDVLWLDPRAPNLEGTTPGLVEQLAKVAGSYNFDNGFQVGGSYRWNSGAIVNNTFLASRRYLPNRVDTAFDFAGISDRWVAPDSVGQLEMPSFGILDTRLAYLWTGSGRLQADFFVDIFNILDDQKATQIESRVAQPNYREGLRFVPPRRYFLGARLRF